VAAANALAMSLIYFGCWMLVAASGGILFAIYGTELRGSVTPALSQPDRGPRP
jgi:hypothetical protein